VSETDLRSFITVLSSPTALLFLDLRPVCLRKSALHGTKFWQYPLPADFSDALFRRTLVYDQDISLI